MKFNHLRKAVTCVFAATVFATALPSPARAQSGPTLDPVDCAVLLKPTSNNALVKALTLPADAETDCGYVTVPEERANDNGKTLKIAVVVLKASGGVRKNDPLFMLQGGPGGSTIETYSLLMRNASNEQSAVRFTRDVVLFDQRGTGRSLPALKCDELYQLTLRTIEDPPDYEKSSAAAEKALDDCRERLIREGVNLNAFDSIENAADIETIREALGYDRINVYGVSYGTLLALHTMRNHPEHLRSVILDAVVPTQNNFMIEAPRTMNRAFTELFKACGSDPVCNKDYPELEKVFVQLIEDLNKTPLRMRVSDPDTGNSYNAFIDGNGFMGLVFQALYGTDIIPILPRIIYDMKAGDTRSLGTLTSLFAFEKSLANGMYFSVVCAEDSDFDPRDAVSDDLRPQVAKNAVKDAESTLRLCKKFNVDQLPNAVDDPVKSDIPTLVFNGNFDPITPPVNGIEAAKTLPNSFVYTFPNTGHGAFQANKCASQIAVDFLDSPGSKPLDTCIKDLGGPKWVGAQDLIRVAAGGEILTSTPRYRQIELGIAILGIGVLATGLLLLPLGWLARLIFSKNHPTLKPPFIANLMPWLSMLNAVLFTAAIGAVLGFALLAAQNSDYSFLLGIRRENLLWFVLPIVSTVFTALIVWGVVAGWRSGAWGLGRKLYRSALALASIAATIVLAIWGTIVLPFF